ncbi:hypothetical protein GCM10010096_11700 [Alcaligenes pakistanensis]|uniref:Uncharacterized protein n=1 Tax=Alcaligenes pakistanensis TaxID=1482717 RepID=A0A8H9M716_9BURK|nr:hypothetical protein GCM10010096_11700 [Alcaligenes pakistanensis]
MALSDFDISIIMGRKKVLRATKAAPNAKTVATQVDRQPHVRRAWATAHVWEKHLRACKNSEDGAAVEL